MVRPLEEEGVFFPVMLGLGRVILGVLRTKEVGGGGGGIATPTPVTLRGVFLAGVLFVPDVFRWLLLGVLLDGGGGAMTGAD